MEKYYYCVLEEKGKPGLIKAVVVASNGPQAVERVRQHFLTHREINKIPSIQEATFDVEVKSVEEVGELLIVK